MTTVTLPTIGAIIAAQLELVELVWSALSHMPLLQLHRNQQLFACAVVLWLFQQVLRLLTCSRLNPVTRASLT
jgi:hypothetical protein